MTGGDGAADVVMGVFTPGRTGTTLVSKKRKRKKDFLIYLTIIRQYSLSLRRIIAQVIIRTIVFSSIMFICSSETSTNREAAILKLVPQYNHLAWVIYGAINDQSERAHLHNHLSNYTKILILILLCISKIAV